MYELELFAGAGGGLLALAQSGGAAPSRTINQKTNRAGIFPAFFIFRTMIRTMTAIVKNPDPHNAICRF